MSHVSEAELMRVYLFRAVNLESVQGILDVCTVRCAAPGDVIIHAGKPNRQIFLLLEGRLRIHPKGLNKPAIVVLGPGEMVGEMSAVDQRPASADVVADEPCRMMVMDEDILWSLIHASHQAARNLLIVLAGRLRHSDRLLTGELPLGEELCYCGTVDALTGLRSRKWLEQVMQRQHLRSMTSGEPLSVILIDVDQFKAFNEKYGRAYSDRILYAIAQNFNNCLRPTDIIARYGGDEFVILLPNVSITVARQLAERLHRDMAKAVPIMPDGKSVPHPTLSMGLAEIGKGLSAEALMTAATAALKRARENGGGCIIG